MPSLALKYYGRAKQESTRKFSQKRLARFSFLAANLIIIAIIGFFVIGNSRTDGLDSSSTTAVAANTINPLDQSSSSDIALTVAQVANLPEATAVANQAQTAAANLAMASMSDNIIPKPEIVTTALKSKADILEYTTVSGDSVASLANKFGVTSNSIMWSNGLTTGVLTAGTKLWIPPVNGIVYVVKAGDTPTSLAQRYDANQQAIIAYNDAEINGLTPGERIIIPNGTLATAASSYSSASGGSGSSASSLGFSGPVYGYNGYDYGYCTWYVATQVPVPSNWGNASSWAFYAALSGWNVSESPSVGSIAQTADAAGGEGHVAIVDAVNSTGTEVEIRDMNGIAGWGRVGYSGWIPVTTFQHYITP